MTVIGGSGLRRALPGAVLVGFCLWFFHPLLNGYTFTTVTPHYEAVFPWRALNAPYKDVPQSDEADLTFPWRSFIHRELGRGTFPLWNPHSFGGQPFFVNGSSGVLYPPNLIAALALPPDLAHDAVSVLHVLLSGVFMFLLMREWRFAQSGSLLAAVAWMLSSFNMAWLHLEVVAPMALWLPASLYFVSRAMRRDEWASTLGAAAALACVMVSGHLLFGGLVYGVALVYTLGLAIERAAGLAVVHAGRGLEQAGGTVIGQHTPTPARWTTVLRAIVIAAGPLCLAAVVLVPTALYLSSLGRESVGYDAVHEGIRVPYDTFRYLLTPSPLPASNASMHSMMFVGTVTPWLAAIGLLQRGRGTLFARLLVAVAFLLATDTVILKWAYAVFPPFSFFSPLGRLLNFFNFGVVVLAGVGFDVLLKQVSSRWLVAAGTALVVGITGWQLLDYARAINPPFVPREARWLFPKTPLIDALESQGAVNGTGPGRILPLRSSQRSGWTPPVLYAAESMIFGIDSAGGYDSTLPRTAENMIRVMAGEDLGAVLAQTHRRAFTTSFEVDRVRFALLPRLGVTTIVTPPGFSDPSWPPASLDLTQTYTGSDGETFRIDGATGGPWLAFDVAAVASADRAAALFVDPAFDPGQRVILEQQQLGRVTASFDAPTAQAWGSIRVVEDGVNTLRATISASRSGWAVVPNVWDQGWTAAIDGRPAPVLRANYLFQAVPVPAGESHLDLEYSPPGLYFGLAVSGVSIGGWFVVLIALVRRPGDRSDRRAGQQVATGVDSAREVPADGRYFKNPAAEGRS